MPIANSHLERLQVKKLLQSIRKKDHEQVKKLIKHGVPNLINYNDPDNGITPLILCTNLNHLETLRLLLRLGASTDIVDFEGQTALMHAAKDGNTELFQILLDARASKEIADLKGCTVLFHCVLPTERHLQCLNMCIDKRTDVNKPNNKGETVLYEACKKSKENESIVVELLNNGADPNRTTLSKRTPFLEACASGSRKAVSLAISRGADVETTDARGRTPVHEAARNGHLEVLLTLSAFGANFDACDNDQNNALHFAAVADEKCCKFVGQRGCNPKVKNQDGQLPRNLATQEGKKLCVRELRKLEKSYGKTVKNTDPWALRLYDWSVVHTDELTERFKELGQYLAEQAEEARQSQLEEAKANEDTAINPEEASPTAVGATAELDTARSGKSTASRKSPRGKKKRRRKKKRDPSVGSTGRTLTPVTRMYVENFENVLQSLSAPYGADCLKELIKFHEKNSDGCIGWQEFLTGKKYVNKNYLMSAFAGKKGKKRRGRKGGRGKRKTKIPLEICTLPKEAIFRRADGGPPIMYIPKQHNHTDPNRFDAEHPPLHPIEDDSVWYINPPKRQYISFHTAAKYSDLDSIRLALSEGYNVDTRDKFYKTPLMVAAHHGNLDAAIALIQLGADVNARDNFKWTPLHHAAHSGMIDVVELLLRNGAVIDARALNGGTPLFRAIECSRLNVVNYIMSQGAKIMIETRKGNNPYDAALAWADPRVIDLVHDRWELAQELADKNKQKKGSSKGKRPGTARSTTSSKRKTPQITPSRPAELPGSESRALNHMEFPSEILARSTTLELANATQEIRYCPKYPWLPQPTRAERLARLAEARERFGWDHGLPGVPLHPFDKNLKNIVKEAEAEAGAG